MFFPISPNPIKKKPGFLTNDESLSDLIYYFREIVSFESEYERIRLQLADRKDFTIKAVFDFFDDNKSGRILPSELSFGLKRMGLNVSESDIYLFIKRFSRDRVEKLTFEEFKKIFISSHNYNARNILSERNNIELSELSQETRNYITRLVISIIDGENGLEFVRQKIFKKCKDLDTLFKSIIYDKESILTDNIIEHLLSENGFYLNKEELNYIILKFDTNNTNRITKKEFMEELIPRIRK